MLFDPTEEAQDAPAGLDARTITQPGDLWNCCGHRVVCGDSTSAEGRSVLMAGSKPVLMVTDQPYGLSYDPRWREEADLGNQRQTGKVANDDRVDWTEAYRHFPGKVAYLWHAGVHTAEVRWTRSCGIHHPRPDHLG